MERIHSESLDCTQSELDLFTVPPTNADITRGSFSAYQPLASLEGSGPLEFAVSGTDEYIDTARICLSVKVTLVNGTQPVGEVAPINNYLHSLFSQVDIYLNGKLISSSDGLYPYRAYFETLLNYTDEAAASQLTCALWAKDTPAKFDVCGPENRGWADRKLMGKSPTMMSWIHSDIFHQPRYLLNNVDLRMRFTRSKPEFVLMTAEVNPVYTARIDEATLYVRKVRPSDSVLVAHARMLAATSAKYPVRRCQIRMISIAPGITTLNKDNLFMGQLPHRIIMGLVDSKAVNGDFTKSPFNFQHFNLNYLSLYVDSEQYPSQPLTPNFKTGSYTRCYQSLLENLDIWRSDKGLPFDRAEYAKGNTLFAFELTPEARDCSDYFTPIRQGNVRMELHFADALTRAVSVVMFAEFQNLLEIDGSRKVTFDYE